MAKTNTEPTSSYKVLSNLRHNGKHYPADKNVDLTEKEAKSLIAQKVVEAAKEPVK